MVSQIIVAQFCYSFCLTGFIEGYEIQLTFDVILVVFFFATRNFIIFWSSLERIMLTVMNLKLIEIRRVTREIHLFILLHVSFRFSSENMFSLIMGHVFP